MHPFAGAQLQDM